MHDPMTVAFDIKSPVRRKSVITATNGEQVTHYYRNTWITIWHNDPEKDGSDDSCGFSYPRLTAKQRERLEGLAFGEARHPWFQAARCKELTRPADAEALMRGVVLMVARSLDLCVSYDEACRWAVEHISRPLDNFRGSLCHIPGYHTNFEQDRKEEREYTATHLFYAVARSMLRERRRWWQHPRWHIHHWRIQVHPLQQLKRWLFSRCEGCGKGFSWGYAPVANGWCDLGPRWFRSERNLYHGECLPAPASQVAS